MTELVAFDVETSVVPGNQAPPLVCASLACGDDVTLVHQTEAKELVEALLDGDEIIIGHNVVFDLGVVAAKWPAFLPKIFYKYRRDQIADTGIRQKLIDIAATSRMPPKPPSLADLARRWFGIKMAKGEDTWRMRYGELIDTPIAFWPDEAKSYALDDARLTLAVYRAQEVQNFHLSDQYRQARAAWWLHLMRCWGLRTDAKAVDTLAARLQKRHDELVDELVEAGLMRPNGSRNTKAAQARMIQVCQREGLALVLTPTGKPKLSAEVCDATGDKLLEAYAETSGLKTKLSNFVGLLRKGASSPLQPWFDPLKETGRTSASPNVQNLPRKGGVRECFVPRQGYVYAAADYSAFELRTVAQAMLTAKVVERSNLAEALNRGFDPHLEIARRLLDISYDEAAQRLDDGDDEVDTARQVGKVANFGFPGGLGARTFVLYAKKGYGVTITQEEAEALKRYWLAAWPEFRIYFAWIGNQCEGGPAKIKQVFVDRYRGGCSFCEACNTMFQGLAADCAKEAGFLIAEACYVDRSSPLFGSRPVNFVHDEFIIEVQDNENASAAAEELARLMVAGASKYLPDVPPLAVPYLMRRWSKSAKPIRDETGKLIAWDGKAA